MARAALSISIGELAEATGLRPSTISAFERGGNALRSTVGTLQDHLEQAGAVFIDAGQPSLGGGSGVRLSAK